MIEWRFSEERRGTPFCPAPARRASAETSPPPRLAPEDTGAGKRKTKWEPSHPVRKKSPISASPSEPYRASGPPYFRRICPLLTGFSLHRQPTPPKQLLWLRRPHSFGASATVLCLLFSVLFLCSSYLSAKQAPSPVFPAAPPRVGRRGGRRQEYAGQTPQYKIFSLTNISADQGAELLAEANIGTVSKFPGNSNALLITASPGEIIKATAILTLADAKELFCVRMIALHRTPDGAAVGLDNLPSNEQIASEIGNISIGTFSSPPAPAFPAAPPHVGRRGGRRQEDAGAVRAIVDVHDNALMVVAPQNLIERIISVIEGRPPQGVHRTTLQEARKRVTQKPPKMPPRLSAQADVGEARQPSEAGAVREPPVPEPAVTPQGVPMTTRRYTPAPIHDGDEILKLNLPEKLTITDLLGLVGEYLGLDFMYDPAQIKGDVTLKLHGKLRGDLRVKDLYPLLESALKFRNFVMTRKGNLVTIAPIAQALDIDPVLMSDDRGKVEQGDIIVTRVFQLQYIDTASAQNFLTAMKLATTVTPIAEAGTLVVTGYAYRMPRIEELLEIIDRPGKPREFRFRQLKFTMAKTLASKVKTLTEQLGTVSITITAPAQPTPTRGRPTRRTPTRPTTPTPTPTKSTVYLDADERTNRILMIGLAEQLDIVDALIDSLDVEQQDLRTLKSYKIEHVDAEEARKKLGELGIIGGSRSTTPSRITAPAKRGTPATAGRSNETTEGLVEEPQVVVIEMTNSLLVNATPEQHAQIQQILTYVDSRTKEEEIPYKIYQLENQDPEELATTLNQLIQETIKDKEGKIQQVVKKTEEEITIIPDKNTFSLIVYASKKNQEWVANLIKQLDKRRPQVLIDVALVEITREELFEYDLNLIANAKDSVTGNTAVTGTLPKTSLHRHNLEAGWNLDAASAFVQGFYSVDKIQALLTAMDKKNYGRILAQPKILVNDNEKGVINTTEKTYVEESTTSYTSEGVPVTTTKWTEYPAKIELGITPNISEGDLLRLEINMLREDFEKKQDAPPDYTTSNINTIVTVPDGSTIILGGLTKLKQSKGGSKVPLLGDIPIVGGLFRTVANSDASSKLYVFVKANILRPDETAGLAQLQRISGENRAAFEKAERRFQEYEDWPGIKPKPIEPLRVLEAE